MRISKRAKGKITKAVALALDIGAPLIATFMQFPAWVERSAGSTVSGTFVVFAILSSIPLFRFLKDIFKSPSAPLLWGVALALLIALRNIVDEMIVICFVGVISNVAGTAIYKIGDSLDRKEHTNG